MLLIIYHVSPTGTAASAIETEEGSGTETGRTGRGTGVAQGQDPVWGALGTDQGTGDTDPHLCLNLT